MTLLNSQIPEGWEIKKLGDIANINYGYTAKASNKKSNSKFLRITDIQNDTVDWNNVPYCSINQQDFDKYKLIDKDIVFARTGATTGKSYLVKNPPQSVAASYLIRLRLTITNVQAEFISNYFQTSEYWNKISTGISGSTQGGFNASKLSALLIPIPPLEEQKKIVEILSISDRLIELTEKLIKAKQKLKQGLMQKLLTGKLRFPKFKGQKWETIKLGKICNIRRGASPRPIGDSKYFSHSGRGWVRISDVTSCKLYLRQTSQYLSKIGEEKSVKVNPGDLIMSICGTIGVCRIVDIPACIHDGFVLITSKIESISLIFLLYVLNNISERLSNKGQPGTQKNLNTGIVSKIEVPNCSFDEQLKIINLLLQFDKELENLESQKQLLETQKKGLMQQLLTGKIRVKIDK